MDFWKISHHENSPGTKEYVITKFLLYAEHYLPGNFHDDDDDSIEVLNRLLANNSSHINVYMGFTTIANTVTNYKRTTIYSLTYRELANGCE